MTGSRTDLRNVERESRLSLVLAKGVKDRAYKTSSRNDSGGPHTAHSTDSSLGKTALTIWDQPSFTGPLFMDVDQADPQVSQTWRATVKVYAICKCEVVREIGWTLEKFARKQKYKNVSIVPASNAALGWINAQLKQDGYIPVP